MPTAKKKPAARPRPPAPRAAAARRPTKANGPSKPAALRPRGLTAAEAKYDERPLTRLPGYKGSRMPEKETRGSLRKLMHSSLPPGSHLFLIRRSHPSTDQNKVSVVTIRPGKTKGAVDFAWLTNLVSAFLNLKSGAVDGHDTVEFRAYNAGDYVVEWLSRELYGVDNAFKWSWL